MDYSVDVAIKALDATDYGYYEVIMDTGSSNLGALTRLWP
jgi:hypothetical protein